MIEIHPRFVTDENGKPLAVQLELGEFERLLEEAEFGADMSGPDPDEGLELRADFIASLRKQLQDLQSGKEKTVSASEARQRLGI